jgi:hypothetical protein
MSFNPDTRATQPSVGTKTGGGHLAATRISNRRDARLLFSAFARVIVYSAAAIGFLLAITFPILRVFGLDSSLEPPTWLGITLLICICIYGYFDIRLSYPKQSKPIANEPKPPGSA